MIILTCAQLKGKEYKTLLKTFSYDAFLVSLLAYLDQIGKSRNLSFNTAHIAQGTALAQADIESALAAAAEHPNVRTVELYC